MIPSSLILCQAAGGFDKSLTRTVRAGYDVDGACAGL
jgi:hypothetical protein